MTLCIAAACLEGNDVSEPMGQRVVLVFDSRIEVGQFSAEGEIKLEWLEHEWTALLSGNDLNQAREVSVAVRDYLNEIGTAALTPQNAGILLIEPAVDKVRRRIDERYVQREYSMSLVDFEDFGETKLGRLEVDRARYDMRSNRIEADIIFIGYFSPGFAIYRFHGGEHRVVRERNFAAVGSGATIALSNLFQRGQRWIFDLRNTMYIVYESQRLGQKAPGVSSDMSMFLYEANPDDRDRLKFTMIAGEGLKALEELYKKFGLQSIKYSDLLDPESL